MSRGRWGRGGAGGAVALLAIGAAACAKPPAVQIESPTEGETIAGPVHVVLQVANAELAPAADNRPGTVHHHLFLDVDVTPLNAAIPQGAEGIQHLGKAQVEWTFDSLARGPHRIIAVLAGPDHVPLAKARADTVNFIVGPWP